MTDDEGGVPEFSDESLVCHTSQFWTGKRIAVIVDREAELIHFQNCYKRSWSWTLWAQAWFSCPLTDVRYARHFCHKGNCSLFITTAEGEARISGHAENYDALRVTLAEIVPPVHGWIRDHADIGAMVVLGAFGGLPIGLMLAGTLLPPNTPAGTYGIALMSGVLGGILCAVLLGKWVLARKHR